MKTPRYLRCYDNSESIDRYTIVFTRQNDGYCRYVSSSDNPFHPQGFYQHGEHFELIDKPSYKHLGKKIAFRDLPSDVRKAVLDDYKNLWPNHPLAWL